jgi:hypothetical protein
MVASLLSFALTPFGLFSCPFKSSIGAGNLPFQSLLSFGLLSAVLALSS